MHDFGEMPLLADQPINRLIEHHRKPILNSADHLSFDLKLVFELENRKFEFNGLALGNPPPGIDKNPCGTDILDDVPKRPFLDGIFHNNKGSFKSPLKISGQISQNIVSSAVIGMSAGWCFSA